jgi:three prime repair exonuclease-1
MAPVLPDVSRITGLHNYNLYGQAKFDINEVELIDSFLRRLPAPVCLVSHNKDRFDFPL